MPPASSPCVKLCVIDPQSGLCAGCGRSLSEIARWVVLSEAERLAIMAALPARIGSPATPGPARPSPPTDLWTPAAWIRAN